MQLPIVKDSDETSEKGVNLVGTAIADLGHIFRENERRDFGIDGQIEIVTDSQDKRYASGRLVAVQIKSGTSYFAQETEDCFIHYCSLAHANYWLGHSLPVVVILCNTISGTCYWAQVTATSVQKTDHGAKVKVPKGNALEFASNALVAMAAASTDNDQDPIQSTYEILLNESYEVKASTEELGVLCGEILRSFQRNEKVKINVSFELEALVARESDVIKSTVRPTLEQRGRLLELEGMYDWFQAKRSHLERGIMMLLNENLICSIYLASNKQNDAALALRSFVEHYIFHRVQPTFLNGLNLDSFPGDLTINPVAKIQLNEEEKKLFFDEHSLGDCGTPLTFPGYFFSDLSGRLMLSRGLPAAVTALLFFADKSGLRDKQLASNIATSLSDWRLGLS